MHSVRRRKLAALPGVTWVVGNFAQASGAEIATSSFVSSTTPFLFGGFARNIRLRAAAQISGSQTGQVTVGDIFAHTELMAAPVFEAANERTRPNLKVQDGCDNRCSFCVIPYVRAKAVRCPRSESSPRCGRWSTPVIAKW